MSFEKALEDEIRRLKDRLAMLSEVVGFNQRTRGGRPGKRKARARKTKRKTNPKLRALRQQQGKYMGLVRNLTAKQKRKVSEIREKKGLRAAIAEARRAAAAKK